MNWKTVLANLPDVDDSTIYFWLTKAQLDFYIKTKIYPIDTTFDDMRFGLVLKEVKRL